MWFMVKHPLRPMIRHDIIITRKPLQKEQSPPNKVYLGAVIH